MIIHKVELDKEIREGWTLRDFVNEIDYSMDCLMYGKSLLRVPRNTGELKMTIEFLIPKHMFTTSKQQQDVIDELAIYYADKYGYEE